MGCKVIGLNIPENVKKVIEEIALGDVRAQVIMLALIEDAKFKRYYKKETESNLPKDYVFEKEGINTFKKVLKSYFQKYLENIRFSSNVEQGRITKGFTSESAMMTAQVHTAAEIIERFYDEFLKPKEERLSNEEVIDEVIEVLTERLITQFLPAELAKGVVNNSQVGIINKLIKEYTELRALNDDNRNKGVKLQEQLADSTLTAEQKTAIKAEIKNIKDSLYSNTNRLRTLQKKLFIKAMNIADKTDSVQFKNYSNLVRLVRNSPNEWFRTVFQSKLLSEINREFNPLIGDIKTAEEVLSTSDQIEGRDENEESLDNEALQTGYDREIKSILKAVNGKIKTYLSSLKQLESPDKVEGKFVYDTNNELGVPLNADGTVLMTNIIMRASFYSTQDFINSIRELSKLSGLEALAKMVEDMENDIVFANECYCQLNKPAIKKCIINVIDGNLNFVRSNYNIDIVSQKTWDIVNIYKIIYSELFHDENDKDQLRELLNKYSKKKSINARTHPKELEEDLLVIRSLFRKYIPNIKEDEINRALINNIDTTTNNIVDILNLLLNYINAAGDVANQLIEYDNDMRRRYYEYKQSKQMSVDAEMPKSNIPSEIYNNVYATARDVAEFITSRNIAKYNLNSTNAEGNTSSDVIYNSYITQLLSQIQDSFKNKDNKLAYRQLNKLKDLISKSDYFNYSAIFFGIPGVTEGLFYRDKNGNIQVNKNANEVLDIYLFDGLKDKMNNASSVYSTMEDGDYFMTLLSMYANGDKMNRDASLDLAGYMLRVPSDAGKNFVTLGQKININGLIQYDPNSIESYLSEARIKFSQRIEEDYELDNVSNVPSEFRTTNNEISSSNLYELLNNGTVAGVGVLENVNFIPIKGGQVKVIFKWSSPLSSTIYVEVDGMKVGKKVNQLSVKKVYTSETENNKNTIPSDFIEELKNVFVEEGIKLNKIHKVLDPNHAFVTAFKQHVIGELNLLVSQLHMMFEEKVVTKKTKTGKEITDKIWVLKKDASNLFDFLHYRDGKQNKDEDIFLDNNGELIGYAFKFLKLFEVGGFKAGDEIAKAISLYGGVEDNPLFIKDDEYGLRLNINRNDLFDPSSLSKNNKFKFAENQELLSKLNPIITAWIENYLNEIDSFGELYEEFNNGKYEEDVIRECFLNYALTYMAFDDILEGNSKFYKDAQTFLKRAKEVQMAGTSYAAVDYMNLSRNGIEDIIFNGQKVSFKVGNKEFNIRNGFRAVTVYNTVTSSPMADAIEADTKRSIIAKGISEEIASRLAKLTADPFRAKTKFNDAQSYITLDEFVRRRHADGTLNEYISLLEKLYDDSIPASEISDEELAKIQVQKNVYYDIEYDTTSGVFYPRQIKNAEFVLIPKFLNEGSQLRNLHDIMVRNDIGQLNTIETSKAANKNVLTYFDIEHGNEENYPVNPNFEQEITSKNAIENYYYRYLYKQQEVPQHFQDAENKVGIQFIKKLIDNVSTSSPKVQNAVEIMTKTYAFNIQDSFNRFVRTMGWKSDNKGRVININDDENIPTEKIKLNPSEYYAKLANEAQRLGMDSNFIDYVTLDETGKPKMPNFDNLVSTKFENIIQAVFNNNITRQTIIGWHGAQITNIGHDSKLKYHPAIYTHKTSKKTVNEKEFAELPKEEQANYEKTQEAVIDVLIPRWSKKIPKDITAEELKELGLNLHIGYRVPTEGKQSIAVLNVVGFLNDSQGSTIMTPDEWVTQTGADFDIDSIYGVCPHFGVTKDGKLFKIKIDTSNKEDDIRRRYIAYVRREIDIQKEQISNQEIKEKFEKEAKRLKADSPKGKIYSKVNELLRATDVFLTEYEDKMLVKKIKSFTFNNQGLGFYTVQTQLVEVLKKLQRSGKVSKTDKQILKQHQETIEDVIKLLDELTGTSNQAYYKEKYKTFKQEEIEKLRAEYLKDVVESATNVGLLSYDEFRQLPIELQNSRKQRDNRMIESMFEILQDVTSLEENYARSNFDDITDANAFIKECLGLNKISRSTYNPIDQIQFYRNAMATRNLKARSVIRDTFASICNKGQMFVNKNYEITVIYDNSLGFIDEAIVKAVYGENIVAIDGKKIKINHNKFGWSNTNRNITGKLLTCYSSETTAHILDAIKEGSLINENEYTFGAFKSLVDMGVDYYTALAILAQPAVSEIVKANGKNASVLNKNDYYPVNAAIKELIRQEYPDFNQYARNSEISDFLLSNDEFVRVLKAVYGNEFDKLIDENENINIYNLPLQFNQSALISNLKGEINNWAYDVLIALQFGKLLNFADKIDALAKCSNPDKFGAKQTIFETERVLDNIDAYREMDVLHTKDGTTFINALYPVDELGNINEFSSIYPHLAAMLKYSTKPSVQINSQVLYLADEKFKTIESTIETQIRKRFNKEAHDRFNEYIVAYAYNSIPYLSYPLTITPNGFIQIDMNRINETDIEEDIKNREFFRIKGFSIENNFINVEDFDNPTVGDIKAFNNLTPVEKVIFIQSNRKDAGIFDLIHVQTIEGKNNLEKGRASILKYTDNAQNEETLYRLFREAFNNKNPFIRLAAIDLIKYSFVVENRQFKRGNISKLIVNSAIKNSIDNYGMNLINVVTEQFNQIRSDFTKRTEFIDRFVRANPDLIPVKKITNPNAGKKSKDKKVKQPESESAKKTKSIAETIYLKYNKKSPYFSIANNNANLDLLHYLGVLDKENERNDVNYIRLSLYNSNTKSYDIILYKIEYNNGVFGFIPLNKLEPNEVSSYSINDYNNIYPKYEYYKTLFDEFTKDADANKENRIEFNKDAVPSKGKTSNANIFYNVNALNSLLLSDNVSLQNGVKKLISAIEEFINSPVEERSSKIVLLNNEPNLAKLDIPKNCLQVINTSKGQVEVIINRFDKRRSYKTPQFNILNNSLARALKIDGNLFTEPKLLNGERVPSRLAESLKKIPVASRKSLVEALEVLKANPNYQAKNLIFYSAQEHAVSSEKKYSTIPLITDESSAEEIELRASKQLALEINTDIEIRSKRGDVKAEKYVESMKHAGINFNSSASIESNLTDVYTAALRYYETFAKELSENIAHFELSSGEVYRISDIGLYEELIKNNNEQDLQKLLKLILDCKTFGDNLEKIYSLNVIGETNQINSNIKRLIDLINSIKNNAEINYANDAIFNEYFAKTFSTNPLVQLGLVKLTDVFDDTSWFDLNIGHISGVDHKQVQNVVAFVYSKLEKAKFTIDKQIADFIKKYDEIMALPGEYRDEVVIDKYLRLGVRHTEQFMEDRRKLIDEANLARDQYGELSIPYQKAKLKLNKWLAENVEQEYIKEYYDEVNSNLDFILDKAPDMYLKYLSINKRIYQLKNDYKRLTKEQRSELIQLNNQIKKLLNPLDVDENLTDAELDKYGKDQSILIQYRDKQKEINKKYFVNVEDADFKIILDNKLEFIKKYDEHHPYDSLAEKLENEEYREAYDWIQFNTYYRIEDETSYAIAKAFNALSMDDAIRANKGSSTYNTRINQVINKAITERPGKVIDEYGMFHPEELTEDEIKQIKDITEEIYTGKTNANTVGLENESSAVLIKSIPEQPIYKRTVYNLFKKQHKNSEEAAARERSNARLVAKINKIIAKAVDPKTGNVSSRLLFENCTEEEIKILAESYADLKDAYEDGGFGRKNSYKSRTSGKRYKNTRVFISTKPNTDAYDVEKGYYLNNLQNTALGKLWLDVFTEDGNIEHPNLDIYGYFFLSTEKGSSITKEESATLIDADKTNARKFINENIEFVEKEAYFIAERKATAEGKYNEWFENNHYFDPYLHKTRPLKIWMEMKIKDSSSLSKGTRVAANMTLDKTIASEDYKNKNWKEGAVIYNPKTGRYNNGVVFSKKEQKMIDLLTETIKDYTFGKKASQFFAKGYIPMRRKAPETDAAWVAKQVIGSIGLQADFQKREFYDNISYIYDKEIDMDMAHLLKNSNYIELEEVPINNEEKGTPQYETMQRKINEIKERNRAIKKQNEELSASLADRNIKNVFSDFISKSIIRKAKDESKNLIYFMQEDLKHREAYKKSRYTGRLIKSKSLSTDLDVEYKTTDQDNTLKLFENWARRVIYDQYKKGSNAEIVASFMQNVTSAKYMIFNVTGGIANILTGKTNILGESFAKDYFNHGELARAEGKYFSTLLSTLSTMYSTESRDLNSALYKHFDVISSSAVVERREGEKLHEYSDRIQEILYGFQTGGEHYMQNVVLLAMMESHRLVEDNGKYYLMSYSQYINTIEYEALKEAIGDDVDLLTRYNKELVLAKNDAEIRRKYDELKENFVVNFIKGYTRETGDTKLQNDYLRIKKEKLSNAQQTFETFATMYDQYELVNGKPIIKEGSKLTADMEAKFKNKVLEVNREIHGVYDKISAARIEAEWWGSLVMQYHKHLYPGFMKRYRMKGYYNELKDSFEKGSYASAINLLFTEYRNLDKRVKNKVEEEGTNLVLSSIIEFAKATIDTITNAKLNWEMLPEWEKNNVRKVYGDLCGVASAMLIAIGLHMATDDDQIKDSNLLSTILYISDRLFSETMLYTPTGVITETRTLMSSPLAATSSVEDLLKALDIIVNISFNEDYNPNYTSGLYRGQNKLGVLLKRNIPAYRVYDRLQHMSKNNQYYRINDNSRNVRTAKNIANLLVEED